MSWADLQHHFRQVRHRFAHRLDLELIGIDERGAFMDAMRRFKNREEANLEQAETNAVMTLEELFLSLTALAEACLEAAYRFEFRYVENRFGAARTPFHIIGMGKFGACEITLHSDLDLIFIFEERGRTSGAQALTHQEFFVRLVQRMISNLSLRTASGRVYEVDTELRPSGRAGVLVSSWPTFAEYHHKDARTWEKQSLLRARPVAEAEESAAQMAGRLQEVLWCREYPPKIAQEIHHLRLRMERELAKEDGYKYNVKVGAGGLVDIEFIVQYLQLRFGRERRSLVIPHTASALRALAAEQLLAANTAKLLEEAYFFYRKIETCLRSLAERSADILPRKESEEAAALAQRMGEPNLMSLLARYETYRHQVRQKYLEVLDLGKTDVQLK